MFKSKLMELLRFTFDRYVGYVPSDRQLELLIKDFIRNGRV